MITSSSQAALKTMGNSMSTDNDAEVKPTAEAKPAIEAKQERTTQISLFLAFSLLFLVTLCRTVYTGDSGEIVNAIFTSGIIHPPGYPLFALLGHLSLLLIPFGEPAFRIGCVVALAGALAVVMLYRFCRELGAARFASLIAAATFGTCYDFWSQTVRVEVYSLHAALYGLAFWGALRYGRTASLKHLFIAALAFSLDLAHHLTIVVLLPALLILAGLRLWTDPKAIGRITGVIATILGAGPPLYLVLMYWAKGEPIENWSRPVTFDALYTHVSAQIYRDRLSVPSFTSIAGQLRDAGGALGDGLMWVGIPIAIAGLALLWRHNRQTAIGLMVGGLAVTAYNQSYHIPDISVYYLPVLWIASALLAYGLDAGISYLKTREAGLLVASACCFLLPCIQVARNYSACNLSNAVFIRDFARHKLEHCDKDGILVLQNDNDGFPVDYVHYVLGVRPDVLLMERHFLNPAYNHYDADKSAWYLHSLRKQGINISTEIPADLSERKRLGGDGALISILASLKATRPLHTTFLDDRTPEQVASDAKTGKRTMSHLINWFMTSLRPVPQGMVIRLLEKDSPITTNDLIAHNKQLWDNTTLPDTGSLRADGELDFAYFTDYTATMLLMYGDLYEFSNRPNEAAQIYTVAKQLAPDSDKVKSKWAKFEQKFHPVDSAPASGPSPSP